jgi:hypothetical protein
VFDDSRVSPCEDTSVVVDYTFKVSLTKGACRVYLVVQTEQPVLRTAEFVLGLHCGVGGLQVVCVLYVIPSDFRGIFQTHMGAMIMYAIWMNSPL